MVARWLFGMAGRRTGHYLDLVVYKAYADLKAEASRTYVNYLWWMIDPLLSLVIYYTVFAVFLQQGGDDFAFVLIVGLVFWRWYGEAIAHGAGTIVGNVGLMGQVDVPKWVFPVVCLITDTTKFACVFVVLMVVLWLGGMGWSTAVLALPLVMMVQLVLIAGAAMLVAACVPFLPDLRHVVTTLLMMQMFLSGVFFRPEAVFEGHRELFFLNPMARLINEYRVILIDGQWPSLHGLLYVAFLGVMLCVFSMWLLSRFDKTYPRLH